MCAGCPTACTSVSGAVNRKVIVSSNDLSYLFAFYLTFSLTSQHPNNTARSRPRISTYFRSVFEPLYVHLHLRFTPMCRSLKSVDPSFRSVSFFIPMTWVQERRRFAAFGGRFASARSNAPSPSRGHDV